ncbi:MAG TPA: response regulator transcription factor [Anaerolineaceae bacterium]
MKENSPDIIQVMVISAIPSLRVGLKTILNILPDIDVIAEAALLDVSGTLPPAIDVVLVAGLEFPSASWLSELFTHYPQQAFLFLINPPASLPSWSLNQRPHGWISLNASPADIRAAVHALQAGLLVIDPLFISQVNSPGLQSSFRRTGNSSPGDSQLPVFESLTPREVEVLECLAQGLANKEIALRLMISEHTVKYHISSIYSKFGANNRTEAVRQGIRSGIIVI